MSIISHNIKLQLSSYNSLNHNRESVASSALFMYEQNDPYLKIGYDSLLTNLYKLATHVHLHITLETT